MRQIGFDYIVRSAFEISEADLDFLIKLSKSHYDLTCRSVGVPGHGAFLHGMKNSVKDGVARGSLGLLEIGLVLKILELPHDRRDLVRDFNDLFSSALSESERMNP